MMSSRYGIQTSSRRSPEQVSIKSWKEARAFERPNGIRIHSYNPQGVINAVRA